MRLRSRDNTIRFLMPLAHVICDSNKARAMIGYVSAEDYQPGITPVPDNWFKTADFDNETAREAQANILESVDIASIFIRFESGHSTDVEIQHCPFMPDMFSLRYLIHGTRGFSPNVVITLYFLNLKNRLPECRLCGCGGHLKYGSQMSTV